MDCEGTSSTQKKIVFKKSIKLRPRNDDVDPQLNAIKIQSTKIVMPEYVVGQKQKKDPKPKVKTSKSSAAASNVLRLSHLDDELDE